LESAAIHRTIAAEKLAQATGSEIPAEPKVNLAGAVAAPEKEPEPKGTELASAKIPERTGGDEQASGDQALSISKNSNASSNSQPESQPCGAHAQKCGARRRHSAKRPRRFYDGFVSMFRAQRY
jgi:hypothetical protein